MKQIMHNVVLLMEPTSDASDVSMKAGKMCLNRFCIDEDAAFESTGVYYLKKVGKKFENSELAQKSKGSKISILMP